jgi:alanyl-tRNA synthetase
MSVRLYYDDSFLAEFDAAIVSVREDGGRLALVLDRSAFYPASGGQTCDTGWITPVGGEKLRVTEVAEDEAGEVIHWVAIGSADAPNPVPFAGAAVHCALDFLRRRDHMQQHSGQHVLSAAFLRLFRYPTVSFHMGDEACTIDLDAPSLADAQAQQAEQFANAVVMEDRPVTIRYATPEQAVTLGVRRIPAELRAELRLIDIQDFDFTACGGTHVRSTGQIGPVLLRKIERVKQGVRVEFVCGERAVRTARRDFAALTETAALYPTHVWDVPQQVRKSLDEIRAGQKEGKRLLAEIADLSAAALLAEAPATSPGAVRVIARHFPERDAAFLKLLAQKLVSAAASDSTPTVALLSASGGPQIALVFAQTPGGPHDMGELMKRATAKLGGRGGGSRDLAQGGAPQGGDVAAALSI